MNPERVFALIDVRKPCLVLFVLLRNQCKRLLLLAPECDHLVLEMESLRVVLLALLELLAH